MKTLMQKFNGVYGKTYARRDETLNTITYIAKGLCLATAVALGVMGVHATSEAKNKLEMLKEDFKAASISKNIRVLDNVINERNKIVKENICVPTHLVWTKNYDSSFYLENPIACMRYSGK